MELFRELEVERLLTCSMLIRHRPGAGSAVTIRRQASPATANREMEWLLANETAALQDSYLEQVLGMRLRAGRVKLKVTNELREGSWSAAECAFETEYPFALRAQVPPWSAVFVARCDGRTTAGEHFRRLQEAAVLPADASEREFARFVATLISGGFVGED
jgi:hypothetical protein